jgi:hypothetical protein
MTDPVPPSAYPVLAPVSGPPPAMPPAWTATVLLHPFGPPPSEGPVADVPFYQLCVGTLDFAAGRYLSARIVGCSSGRWWYVVTPAGTRLSVDGGATWSDVTSGWTLPTDWYGARASTAACAGSSPMNWMSDRALAWWKITVPLSDPQGPPGATWMWFDAATNDPVRMMFGCPPPSPLMGDPTQLAFLQMFSLTYFASFETLSGGGPPEAPAAWAEPTIPGFRVGNPEGFKPFAWSTNQALTAFSTPVNGNFNPLASRTLYVWKSGADYKVYTDRAQSTLMLYTYNPDQPAGAKPIDTVTSLLTGIAPKGVTPPPHSGTGFLSTVYRDGTQSCESGKNFPFGAEAPDWISTPGVQGTIRATISDNAVLCPNTVVNVWSVMFPPATNYPDGTYLWTWYAPVPGTDGTASRPVVFMQSDSGVNTGTSLALADYFYFEDLKTPIDPANFDIPAVCLQTSP